MSKHSDSTPRKKLARALKSASASRPGKVLSFSDLEIPVEPLLTKAQEQKSGRRVRVCLTRMARLLPLHPTAFNRFMARMTEVLDGGGLMFSWLTLRERMAADSKEVGRALEKAHVLAAKDSPKTMQALAPGVKILRTYPLDPETLTQWARQVVNAKGTSPLFRIEFFHRIEKILRRIVAVLEKERDRLVLPNLRLVLKEVFRYHPTGMRRSDLFQEGILGLQKAVYRFDAERNIRFSTYATYWIRQSIRKSLIDKARMIRVPQAIQEELRKSDSKLSEAEKNRVRKIMGETYLFSYGESNDSNDRSSFEVKDLTHPELGAELHTGTIPAVVSDALQDLSSREREILQRRFGLGGERPQTLEEIGIQLNLSRERIRQIEQEALARMRHSRELLEVYEDLDVVDSSQAISRN